MDQDDKQMSELSAALEDLRAAVRDRRLRRTSSPTLAVAETGFVGSVPAGEERDTSLRSGVEQHVSGGKNEHTMRSGPVDSRLITSPESAQGSETGSKLGEHEHVRAAQEAKQSGPGGMRNPGFDPSSWRVSVLFRSLLNRFRRQ